MNKKAVHSKQTIRWYTHCLSDDMPRESVAGGIAIIVDVLRASTTIVTALEAGAVFVKPVVEVEEARRLRSNSDKPCLLGGEREGVQITGFGAFEAKHRKARTGRNPRTGDTIQIPASKTPGFKAGKGLKDAIQ